MFPPPPVPPADPGSADDDDRRFSIGDQEFAIVRPVFEQLVAELEYNHCEEGGVLFGVPGTKLATLFVRDKTGKKTATSFTLDTTTLNKIIRRAKPWNLELIAVVHSHPPNVWRPSAGDIRYVRQLFAHPRNGDTGQFFMPLLVNGVLIPYLVFRDDPDRVVQAQLKIIG
jgi:proteasome lid subunit RPN8/RPN11